VASVTIAFDKYYNIKEPSPTRERYNILTLAHIQAFLLVFHAAIALRVAVACESPFQLGVLNNRYFGSFWINDEHITGCTHALRSGTVSSRDISVLKDH
jgi:hypothetical protein